MINLISDLGLPWKKNCKKRFLFCQYYKWCYC